MFVAAIINVAVISFTMVIITITKDTSALAYLIPSVGAEVATATGFYYSKAKTENRIKLMKDSGVQPTPESFREDY